MVLVLVLLLCYVKFLAVLRYIVFYLNIYVFILDQKIEHFVDLQANVRLNINSLKKENVVTV